MSKAIELARKLNALAKRGDKGERDNAAQLLRNLLRKTGLRMEDVEGETLREVSFAYRSAEDRRLVAQVLGSIIPHDRNVYSTKNRKRLYAMLSCAEQVEAFVKIPHYRKLFKREQNAFFQAFLLANDLYAKRAPGERTEHEPTEAEIEEWNRWRAMAQGIRKDIPAKRLERPEKLTA